MLKNNNLFFLWGLMGCGKSYWAHYLAKKLSYNYIDTDTLIENKTQLSTTQIFEKFGESFFREKEKMVLQDIINTTTLPTIVATGGGLPCFNNNAQTMINSGVTFFLNTDIDVIAQRVFKHIEKRPLLKSYQSIEELELFLTQKLNDRLPFYNQAEFVFNNHQISEQNFIQVITKFSTNNEV